MEISINEASKRFKVSRSSIYRALESGNMSRAPSGSGKIEVSEFLRVFPKVSQSVPLETAMTHPETTLETVENHPLYKAQQEKIRMLEDTLRQAQEREEWQRGQMEKLTDTIKLLEAPKVPTSPRRVWWKFWEN